MIKTDLIKMVRYLLDDYGTQYLRDFDSTRFCISDALDQAYKDFAYKTKCFKSSFATGAISGQSEYAFSHWGSGATRLFELTSVCFAGQELYAELSTQLGNNFRFATASTPSSYIIWGSNKIKLNPPPSTTGSIYIEGYVLPDVSTFTSGAAPDLMDADAVALAYDAAIKAIARNPKPENVTKQPYLKAEYDIILASAIKRINSTDRSDIVIGSGLGQIDNPLN